MSRCTIPWAWAWPSAAAISRLMPQRLGEVELPLPGHPGPKRLALDVGHGVVGQPIGGARVEQRQDVGVLEPGGDLDFAKEALRPQRLSQGGMQHLERHRALVPEVLGQVHRGHAPAAQLALQQVAVRESGRQSRGQVPRRRLELVIRDPRRGSTHGNLGPGTDPAVGHSGRVVPEYTAAAAATLKVTE